MHCYYFWLQYSEPGTIFSNSHLASPLIIHKLLPLLLQRVLQHKEESALLKAYISEWTKYFTQCDHLPKPFQAMEMEGTSNKPKKRNQEGNRVQLVRGSLV